VALVALLTCDPDPTSARSFGSIALLSPFSSGRNTPGYRQTAHAALRESVLTPTSQRVALRRTQIPGAHGIFLKRLQSARQVSLRELASAKSSSGDEDIGSDDSSTSSADSNAHGPHHAKDKHKAARPATALHPTAARVRCSVFLQDMDIPWRQFLSSGCLTPVTTACVSSHEHDTGGQEVRSMILDRAEGREKLRAASARRFVSSAHRRQMPLKPHHSDASGLGALGKASPESYLGELLVRKLVAVSERPRRLTLPGSSLPVTEASHEDADKEVSRDDADEEESGDDASTTHTSFSIHNSRQRLFVELDRLSVRHRPPGSKQRRGPVRSYTAVPKPHSILSVRAHGSKESGRAASGATQAQQLSNRCPATAHVSTTHDVTATLLQSIAL